MRGLHPRSDVAGKRVVVEYEEEGIVRYPGVVIAYSISEGLCVRFDGFTDASWVDEDGDDDWEWEDSEFAPGGEEEGISCDACGAECFADSYLCGEQVMPGLGLGLGLGSCAASR